MGVSAVTCANETIVVDITTAVTGMQILLDLECAPTVYALSLLSTP